MYELTMGPVVSFLRTRIRRAFRLLGLEVFQIATMPRGISLEIDLIRLLDGERSPVLFDVGANIGQTSLRLNAIFGNATIHAFEPVAATFAKLVQNIRRQSGIVPHHIALGSHEGTANMLLVEDSGSNRIIGEENITEGTMTEIVGVKRLDTFCRKESIERIHLLKMDCEGHERYILEGGERLFSAKRIDMVYCEVNFLRHQRQGEFFELEEWLGRRDFVFYALYDYSGWKYDISKVGFTNALFVRRDISSRIADTEVKCSVPQS